MSNPETSQLKKYAEYLIDVYIDEFEGNKAGLYFQLNQFIEEGKIKDIFSVNTKQKSKIKHLEWFKQEIENFGRYHLNEDIQLKNFDEFIK